MMKKISSIVLIIFSVLYIFIAPVVAANVDVSIFTNTSPIGDKIDNIWSKLAGPISTIGVGIAAIMLIVVAIKYMAAAPNDKAEIKKHLVIYVVGAIFIFCCVGIVNLLKLLADGLFLS